MATPRKLNVFFGFPSYGGNGGISSEVPDIRDWMIETILTMKKDERVGEIKTETIGDTPITMVRNLFVKHARAIGADVLVMVDSDMGPNYHRDSIPVLGWKPFWDSSFDFLYEHWEKGPVVIGAPYGGPPEVAENMREQILRLLQEPELPGASREAAKIPADRAEELRSLGYVE